MEGWKTAQELNILNIQAQTVDLLRTEIELLKKLLDIERSLSDLREKFVADLLKQ